MRCASLPCDNGASSMFPEPYGPQINKVEDRTMIKDPMFPGSCVTKALISQGSLCSQIKMIDNVSKCPCVKGSFVPRSYVLRVEVKGSRVSLSELSNLGSCRGDLRSWWLRSLKTWGPGSIATLKL